MSATVSSRLNEVARRYASALFELAQESGELETTYKGMQAFGRAIAESEELRDFLSSAMFRLEDKAKALTAIAGEIGAPELVKRFVGTLALNGRARDLGGAVQAFDELYVNQRGIKRAVVRTATALSEAQRERLSGLLAKAVGGEVDLREEVDESLIGGIQLKIGSKLVDASLRARLERLNTAMKGA